MAGDTSHVMFERDFGEGAFEDESDDIDRLCQEALAHFEEGDLHTAKARAMEGVAMDDEHPFPMFVLGMIAEFEGDIASARDLADLALRTAPTNADAIQLRAQVHVREHELEDAEQILRFGILHNPDDAVLHEGLARVLLATGRTRPALVAANTALRLDATNGGALAVRSASLDALDDRDSLLAALRQTVQMHPDDAYSMIELAAIEAERGNLARARALVSRAQRLRPADREIAEARLLFERGHEWPLLRPLPGLLAWLREFPGGLSGFLLGLVVAALPLHALTQASPAYALPAWLAIGTWAAVATYAWVGPSVLRRRLSRVAAGAARETFYESMSGGGQEAAIDLDAVLDLVHLQLSAHQRRAAVETLRVAATASEPSVADALLTVARRLDRRVSRILGALVVIPGLPRLLTAIAAALLVAAPVVDGAGGHPGAYVAAAACLAIALATATIERAQERMLAALTIELPSRSPDHQAMVRDAA